MLLCAFNCKLDYPKLLGSSSDKKRLLSFGEACIEITYSIGIKARNGRPRKIFMHLNTSTQTLSHSLLCIILIEVCVCLCTYPAFLVILSIKPALNQRSICFYFILFLFSLKHIKTLLEVEQSGFITYFIILNRSKDWYIWEYSNFFFTISAFPYQKMNNIHLILLL
jgi:hypothetical protein